MYPYGYVTVKVRNEEPWGSGTALSTPFVPKRRESQSSQRLSRERPVGRRFGGASGLSSRSNRSHARLRNASDGCGNPSAPGGRAFGFCIRITPQQSASRTVERATQTTQGGISYGPRKRTSPNAEGPFGHCPGLY